MITELQEIIPLLLELRKKRRQTPRHPSIRPLFKRIKISKSAVLGWQQSRGNLHLCWEVKPPSQRAQQRPRSCQAGTPGLCLESSPEAQKGLWDTCSKPHSLPAPPHLMLFQSFLLAPGWMTSNTYLRLIFKIVSAPPPPWFHLEWGNTYSITVQHLCTNLWMSCWYRKR